MKRVTQHTCRISYRITEQTWEIIFFILFVCLFAVLFWARRTGPPPPGIVWDSAAAAEVGGASQIFSSVGSKDPLEIGRECE